MSKMSTVIQKAQGIAVVIKAWQYHVGSAISRVNLYCKSAFGEQHSDLTFSKFSEYCIASVNYTSRDELIAVSYSRC